MSVNVATIMVSVRYCINERNDIVWMCSVDVRACVCVCVCVCMRVCLRMRACAYLGFFDVLAPALLAALEACWREG